MATTSISWYERYWEQNPTRLQGRLCCICRASAYVILQAQAGGIKLDAVPLLQFCGLVESSACPTALCISELNRKPDEFILVPGGFIWLPCVTTELSTTAFKGCRVLSEPFCSGNGTFYWKVNRKLLIAVKHDLSL